MIMIEKVEIGDLEFVHALRHGDIEDIPPMCSAIADRIEALSNENKRLKAGIKMAQNKLEYASACQEHTIT